LVVLKIVWLPRVVAGEPYALSGCGDDGTPTRCQEPPEATGRQIGSGGCSLQRYGQPRAAGWLWEAARGLQGGCGLADPRRAIGILSRG
jgi:hypothetical protein